MDITAVTDTNVMLDIYSCHDLMGTYYAEHEKLGVAAVDALPVVYRRARARESLLLGMYFNGTQATTYSLHFETTAMLKRRAPPVPGGATMESDFVRAMVCFTKDYVLPDWNPQMPTQPGTEEGNAADKALIAFAKEHGLPLITNEGYGQNGLVDERMRKTAREEGVAVFSPREFYQGKIDEAAEIEAFLRRFEDKAPAYMEAHRAKFGRDKIGEVVSLIYGYYRMVLLGEIEGRTVPVRLSIC